MQDDPYVKAILGVAWRGARVELAAPVSTFASGAVDPGSRMLLDALPGDAPRRFCDLGCGYGAVGLVVAAVYPRAHGLLVDRDLLAVEYCQRNARALCLGNVEVAASLGWSRLSAGGAGHDWVLANLPARAGEAAWTQLFSESALRLAPGGRIFAVVIAPLAGAVERAATQSGMGAAVLAASPRHVVLALRPGGDALPPLSGLRPYERDCIDVWVDRLKRPLRLTRPTDLADEPHRLEETVPLLSRALPAEMRQGGRALAFRCGYGLVPMLLLELHTALEVVATDRDLLATEQTRANAAASGKRLDVVEAAKLDELESYGRFDLVVGELLPPLGAAATAGEISAAVRLLAPGGVAVVAGLRKLWREALAGGNAERWQRVQAGKTVDVYACSRT